MDPLDRLDHSADSEAEVAEHFEPREFRGLEYRALPDARHGLARGTVCVDGEAVVGYPSIARILALDEGVRSTFDGAVAIEEKLDGYNVRVADVGGEEVEGPLAFTRSGYVCPYTTERARESFPEGFFDDHPDLMLCAELLGPETPYKDHDYDPIEHDDLRVFDVRDRESGEPLDVGERRDLLAEYDIDQPRLFGVHDSAEAPEAVWDAIRDLDAEGREGVVLKSPDAETVVKYTTESHHHDELAYAFSRPFERGRDFAFSRVVREAFQAAEFDDDERVRERARDLGEAMLVPMVETIREVADGETPGDEHVVRGDADTLDELLDHLRDLGITVEVEDDYREDGERVVEFLKVAESTRDKTEYYLDGGTRDE